MKKPRVKRLRLDADETTVQLSWASSKLIIREYDNGGVIKEAVIAISAPYVLRYIEEQIENIKRNWRDALGD